MQDACGRAAWPRNSPILQKEQPPPRTRPRDVCKTRLPLCRVFTPAVLFVRAQAGWHSGLVRGVQPEMPSPDCRSKREPRRRPGKSYKAG